ncbi:DnaB-like helicase N-terminal domain-containing protein [Streptomyces sp. HPF1205]|uniref:DnaB-like helicase N-terminal domain-containing protein n=1 Tax=Streptomyces sp. HPF1205 TaxID=2873262 RepID=UPI001CEDF08E|nr:DnaB-like helicase N-terminal domain-containing protein [Streptomyces sp. HPF1205]
MSQPVAEDVAALGLEDAHAQVTHMVERALLGGLLLSRAARAAVRPWLTPEHFRSWTHAAVYRAVLDLEDAGDVDDGDERAADRPRAVAERAAVPGATPAYVSALAGACPRTDHIPHYGRLVVRYALRRAVGEQAIRLARRAEEADLDDRSAVRDLAVGASDARRAAGELAGESALDAGVLSDEGRPLDREVPPTEEEVTAARVAGGPGAVPMTEAMLRETALVAALVREPALLEEPEVQRLTPHSFTNRACGVLFAAVRSLRSRGEAVDELLAVAEADTVAPWTEGFGPAEAREALTVAGGGGAAYLAQRIFDHAVQEEALRAAAELQAAVERTASATPSAEVASGPRPVVVFVAGDPVAAGAAAVLVRDALARRGSEPVTLGRGFPPDHALRAVVDASGTADAAARYRVAEEYVRAKGLDTVVHTRAADPEALAAAMRRFRTAGFRVELAAVPLSEPQRRLSALDVHLQRDLGGPPPPLPEDRLPDVLRLVDNEPLADTVSVFRPDGTALYLNHASRLPDGSSRWSREPEAAATAVREAIRPWTAEESVRFSARYAKVAAQCGP